MSIEVMNWVWRCSETTGNDRLLLLALADEANDFGASCYPGLRTLSTKVHVHISTVQRGLVELEELGEVLIHRPVKQGRGHFNRYLVLMGRSAVDFVFDEKVKDWKGSQVATLPDEPEDLWIKSGSGTGKGSRRVAKNGERVAKNGERVASKGALTPNPITNEQRRQPGATVGNPNCSQCHSTGWVINEDGQVAAPCDCLKALKSVR